MREIIISISNGRITASSDIAGYQGEHNATTLKFELPSELRNGDYTHRAIITLPDGVTATVDIKGMSLSLTKSLTASDGTLQLQVVVSKGDTLVYKSGVANLKIKPSLVSTTVLDNGSGILTMVVDDNGDLIVTLTDSTEINAGRVRGTDGKNGLPGEKGDKGDKGDNGESYTLTTEDRQAIVDEVSNDIVKSLLNHDIEAVDVPNGVAKIFANQFAEDKNLQKIVIPDSVVRVETSAFENCFRLISVEGANSVKNINANTFKGCYSLTRISLSSLQTMATNVFENCCSLEEIILPVCFAIDNYAFSGCVNLTYISIPSCTYAGTGAFKECINISQVDLGDSFNCNNLDLSVSTKYSVETLVNMLNSLKNRKGETAYTLILGTTNLAKLSAEQKKVATDKNWVLR